MINSLKDVLAGINLPEEKAHRTKDIITRPEAEVPLRSLSNETSDCIKTQKDPTDDLVFCIIGSEGVDSIITELGGYYVWCEDTKQLWYAHDKLCLDKNFIYREDLIIKKLEAAGDAEEFYNQYARQWSSKIISRKSCYILDIPANETYEVFYAPEYVPQKYGKCTPSGMRCIRYDNRFHRDMGILELDKLYSESSKKKAGEFTAKKFKENEAVIITDGAWMKETCTSAYWYLDNYSTLKMVEGVIPSEPDQAVLISEVHAAYNALLLCQQRGKKRITYFYDNTSILNVFKNRKTEYIEEVKGYKDLLVRLDKEGYQIKFVELHPKSDEEKDELNKALVFFHNSCDAECRIMADIVKKNYKQFIDENPEGTSFKQFQQENKPKGRPKNQQGNNNNNKKNQGNYRR